MSSKKPKGRREINRQATRAAILRAARKLFAKHGYAGTPLESIVRAAKVTTGAVYDHFGDKKALFQAVAEGAELEILERLGSATKDAPDAWSRLVTGTMAMLEICSEPDIRQIVFVDAPNVIGVAEWHAIELRYGYGAMRETLRELLASGQIRRAPLEMLAPMLLGALITAASRVALAPDPARALTDAREMALIFLQALKS
jgi:AcrR family transcriptional regulator